MGPQFGIAELKLIQVGVRLRPFPC